MPLSDSLRRAVGTAVVLATACGLLVHIARRPPRVVPAAAPPGVFSAERALVHVRALAERPHPVGSMAHDAARDYALRQLQALGLVADLQEATGMRGGTAARVQNVVARVNGSRRAGPAILLAAHYDGVPSGPAAGDDGAGVAAVLEALRALRSSAPLANDVIVLLTDGEELGLLGADAFVTSHPWAKDVGLVLNFEARGTTGRSMMFETGRRNLDVVRTLRDVGDASASSLMVTVYRNLPNDTDLSVFAKLGQPALNFAFIGGVQRYHTPFDDVAHLDAGSVQHHGNQMLALLQRFGRDSLPRPQTGDAVFFDLPVLGVVYYPELLALPLAVVVAIAALWGAWMSARHEPRPWRGVLLGFAGVVLSAAAGAWLVGLAAGQIGALHARMQWDGSPGVQGVYAAAMVLLALTVNAGAWALVRRWAEEDCAWMGAIVAWSLLAIASAAWLTGVSFLLAWPLAGAAALAWSRTREGWVHDLNGWAGTLLGLAVLVPVISMVGGYALPLDMLGGQAAAVLTALAAWLFAPHVETMLTERRATGLAAALALTAGVTGYAMATVRRSDANPTPVTVIVAQEADSGAAWLTHSAGMAPAGSWASAVMGDKAVSFADTAGTRDVALSALAGTWGWRKLARAVPRLPFDGVRVDSLSVRGDGTRRSVSLRLMAPSDAAGMTLRVRGAQVRAATVDTRALRLDEGRKGRPFAMDYFAPPRAGVPVTLELEGTGPVALDVAALRYGVPLAALGLPPRPANVVPAHLGDLTLVTRRVVLP
ncbi:MAG: M28 family peptidase [Gemmatimonadetes bacterium]|nr:M28 family peptidase [Gemmatimonadota bacterium]